MNFAVIGTNFITDTFLSAAALHREFKLVAVCASSKVKAELFAAKYGNVPGYGDYRELLKVKNLDAVYIATPNDLHCEMALFFLENGIPVLCEKPLAPNLIQVCSMVEASARKGTLLMEGIVPLFLPNFQSIRDHLHQLGPVRKGYFTYCQYSSRYDKLKAGALPNAFNPAHMGGSLMDIGIYPLYHAVSLFGKPDKVTATARLLPTGVDGSGVVILHYKDKELVVSHSKVSDTALPSEIQGESGCITYTGGSVPRSAQLCLRGGIVVDISKIQHKQRLYYELEEFIRCVKAGGIQSNVAPHSLALDVYGLTDRIRKQTGVKYSID